MLRAAVTGLTIAAAALPGGSNYSWYQVDRPQPGVCIREPYGVIPNFDRANAQIRSELAQMVQNGQRRLRIGIFHGRGLNTGTIMDSTGGDLSARNRQNLAGLLAAARAAGFAQVEVAFHPQGPSIDEWTTWDESRFLENWHVIRNLRPIIRAAGIPYRIDLANEAIPGAGQQLLLRYSRRLWKLYSHAFGRDDTVGFSVIADPARIRRIPEVYGDRPPYTFDLHFYGDEHSRFRAADDAARQLGLQQPWIVGEAFYDDSVAAQELRDAIVASRRTVYYLTQWPLTRGSACADVDVPSPTAFDAYAAQGFDALQDPSGPPRATIGARRVPVSDGRAKVGVRCESRATRCYGMLALRSAGRTLSARRFSAYAGRTAFVRAAAPATARSAAVVLIVRSENSTATTRRTIGVRLVRK